MVFFVLIVMVFSTSRAAFEGARIILRQNSAESETIFDLLVEMHRRCEGDWDALASQTVASSEDLKWFLEYASMFLANLGNYSVSAPRGPLPFVSLSDYFSGE